MLIALLSVVTVEILEMGLTSSVPSRITSKVADVAILDSDILFDMLKYH